jgi:hypothetical protein
MNVDIQCALMHKRRKSRYDRRRVLFSGVISLAPETEKPAEIAGFLRIERGSGQLPAAVAGSSKK